MGKVDRLLAKPLRGLLAFVWAATRRLAAQLNSLLDLFATTVAGKAFPEDRKEEVD